MILNWKEVIESFVSAYPSNNATANGSVSTWQDADGVWVLMSYRTPIARRFNGKVWCSTSKLSVTTSKQQRYLGECLSRTSRLQAWLWHDDPVTYAGMLVMEDEQLMSDLKARYEKRGAR